MSTIGNSSAVVTLTSAQRNVTVTGAVNAFGSVGAYVIDTGALRESHTFDAAIFGPAGGTGFTIVNDGHITSTGTNLYGAGIVLGHAGTITNAGTITAVDGIAIFGTAAGAKVINSELIDASLGFGVYLQGNGQVQNKGALIAGTLGVALGDGGKVINSGTIETGKDYGNAIVIAGGHGYVHNTGLITAGRFGQSTGIFVAGIGEVVNAGTVNGSYGIRLGGPGTVTNTGKIFGGEGGAIELAQGGTVNDSGYLAGASGIRVDSGVGHVQAAGTIHGEDGIYLAGGGTVTSSASIIANIGIYVRGGLVNNTGLIEASFVGIGLIAGSLQNSGHILSGGTGVELSVGGTVNNAGTISGSSVGVLVTTGGTVIDTGVIDGGQYAVSFASNAGDRLVISPTARFGGTVQLGGGALEFAAGGTIIGTFAPGSQQILNAGSITIDTGAIWDIAGTFTNGSDGVVVNNGTIKEGAGDLITINGPIMGTGLIELGKKPLTVESTVAAGQKLKFTGTGEVLVLGDAPAFHGKIEDFALGETIGVLGISRGSITGTHFAGGVLTLEGAGHTVALTFASPATFGSDVFVLTANGAGTDITLKKPAMSILTPTVLPDSGVAFEVGVAGGAAMNAGPAPLAGLTMFAPGNFGIAAHLLHSSPTSLPVLTLQP
jgi:filamentous hemagglutinin